MDSTPEHSSYSHGCGGCILYGGILHWGGQAESTCWQVGEDNAVVLVLNMAGDDSDTSSLQLGRDHQVLSGCTWQHACVDTAP